MDAEDIADGVVVEGWNLKPVIPANQQKEAVLSSLVVEMDKKLTSVQDSISFLEVSGAFAHIPAEVRDALVQMRDGLSLEPTDVPQEKRYLMGAARALSVGYKVVPINDPMLPEWKEVDADSDLKELICMLYDINYNIASPAERSEIERLMRLWFNAIHRALS